MTDMSVAYITNCASSPVRIFTGEGTIGYMGCDSIKPVLWLDHHVLNHKMRKFESTQQYH
jgi:hypothetical protein